MILTVFLVPIDAFAGQNDQADTGGNSTAALNTKTAVLTTQQAVDLEKAVKIAIEGAIDVLAAGAVSTSGFKVANQLTPVSRSL